MELEELIQIPHVSGVRCLQDVFETEPSKPGTLLISLHILLFESSDCKFQLIHKIIEKFDTGDDNSLIVITKDFNVYTLFFQQEEECLQVLASLVALSEVSDPRLLLPFYCKPNRTTQVTPVYDEQQEFRWLEFPPPNWEICATANDNFTISDCYSPTLVIPTGWEDVVRSSLAPTRDRGRVPRPTYQRRHRSGCHVMLLLAGRPSEARGLLHFRLQESQFRDFDQEYMNRVAALSGSATLVTQANFRDKMGRRDYEKWSHLKVSLPTEEDLSSAIDEMRRKGSWSAGNRRWLQSIWSVFSLISDITVLLRETVSSVLVEVYPHLITSLVQICLESRYRTTYGLVCSLLHKDWLHAGYNFTTPPCPEFTLFLHCVRQMTLWYPTAFEFSESLLIFLHSNCHASRYGDFLGTTERERVELGVPERTLRLWTYEFEKGSGWRRFNNPRYSPQSPQILQPRERVAPETILPWPRMFLKHRAVDRRREEVEERGIAVAAE